MAPRRLRPAWLVPPAVGTLWARGRGFCNGRVRRLASDPNLGAGMGRGWGTEEPNDDARAASVTTSGLAER